MKRKILYSQKNSLFSNTINMETKVMDIKVSKVYKVGNVEYTSKEEAVKASAMEILNKEIPVGLDNVLAKADEIISALKIVSRSAK